jgi:hypothetical protein
MDEPRQLKPLRAALQKEASGAVSLQRVARMQELARQLTEALTPVADARAGGASFRGDLWDGMAEAEDVEEDDEMDQEPLLKLIDVLDELGVAPQARRDALARAE